MRSCDASAIGIEATTEAMLSAMIVVEITRAIRGLTALPPRS
jgi:hypothetical protein